VIAEAARRPAWPTWGGSARHIKSHWRLLLRLTRHDLQIRYAGSLLGLGWIFLGPLLILGIYSLIYLEIFRVRGPTGLSGPAYVIYIFCGLVPYLATAQALSFGVTSVISNKSVLNNTVFPIDLTPVKATLSAQAIMLVGIPLVVVGSALTGHAHVTIVALPLVWALNIIWLMGVNWVISVLNVLFRDLQNLLTAILMILLVASPFAYTPSMVPASLKPMLLLNPFAYFVVAYQQVVMLGQIPDGWHALVLVLMPILTFAFGSWFFDKVKGVAVDYV
jgi:homopolymeric O-antigen transport system permease protein